MGLFDKFKKIPTVNELQGSFGENMAKLFANIDIPEALVIKDVLIDGYEGHTSQIDLLVIGEKGIYVVEVKLYPEAKIYGDGNNRNWYYYKFNHKYEIYSPLLQNKNHIKYLKEFLKDFGNIPCFSVIALLCEDFKVSNINKDINYLDTIIVSGLLSLRDALEVIAKDKQTVLTKEHRQQIYEYIKNNQYIGKDKRQEHKNRVINLKKEMEHIEDKCPICNSSLVLRNGKYGEFYGCSNYPKCRYTRKIK